MTSARSFLRYVFILTLSSRPLVAQESSGTNYAPLVGRWEYRQAAGTTYDEEGEIVEFTVEAGRLRGVYLGLEREGDHGLYYTVVELVDLTFDPQGNLSFTVPARQLFRKRPRSLEETSRFESAGLTRDTLLMKGTVGGDRLKLACTSAGQSCPEASMVFRKGRWRPTG